MSRRQLALGGLGSLAASVGLPGCGSMPAAAPSIAALDAELAALVNDPLHPLLNVSALALRNGRVAYQNQFGPGWLAADGTPLAAVGPRTLFRVASVSKLVVAVALMRLVEAGQLALDEDVSGRLGWTLRNPAFPQVPITLRLLLSHRSSLTDGNPPLYGWDGGVSLHSVLSPAGSRYQPGAYWRSDRAPGWFNYVNLNWGVIATVMECATGERFDQLMQRLVLAPLGLRGGFNPAGFPVDDVAHIATLYRKRSDIDGREVWDPAGPWVVQADDFRSQAPTLPAGSAGYRVGSNGTLFGPQGRLRISVADLGTLMQMLLDGGLHLGRTFLQPASVGLLASEQWRFDARHPNGEADHGWAQSWGLGAQRFTDTSGPGRGDRLVEGGGLTGWGHLGDAYGLKAAFVLDPAARTGVIVVLSGPGIDPATHAGQWSAMDRWQERALTAVARHAKRP